MKAKQKILYLHGLESPQGGPKVDFLSTKCFVHAPEMDYTRHDIFDFMIKTVNEFKPDIIIGSSMGGYSAFILGALYKIPVLAFNPALHVIGEEDTLIEGNRTLEWLKDNIKDKFVDWKVEHVKGMGHRVPLDVFTNMYNKIV